jgi:uncharacterized membrane protein YccC
LSLLPPSAALRHAIRITVAAVLASELTWLLRLPQGYWAVITTLIVVQASIGGTLGASVDRVVATMAGACAGAIAAVLQSVLQLPQALMLILACAPMAMLAYQRPSFRLAPVTAAMILMMGGSEESALRAAFDRVLEIALGCVIGILTAQFIFPSRARPLILESTASLLEAYGKLAHANLTGLTEAETEPLREQSRQSLLRIVAVSAEENRERAVHLTDAPDTAPLIRTLRRLRSDVAILGRVMAVSGAHESEHLELGHLLKAHFDQLATFMRGNGPAPDLAALDANIGEQPETGTLHFALVTLRRDLADLDERLSEHLTPKQSTAAR